MTAAITGGGGRDYVPAVAGAGQSSSSGDTEACPATRPRTQKALEQSLLVGGSKKINQSLRHWVWFSNTP